MSDFKISITLDAKELIKQLGLTKEELQKLEKKDVEIKTDKATSSIANLRRAVAEWSLALDGAIRLTKGAVKAISNVANAAMYQQKTVADLGAALRNTGVYSKELEVALLAQADAIQDVTTASSDDVVMMTRQMQVIGRLSGEELPAAQKAAVGLAKAYQIDLKTAFELVGKAAAGNTSVLGRYGIVLDASMSQAEKFDEVLRRGAEGFELAEAETATAAGAVEQLKNAWGDFIEDFGEMVILPALEGVSRTLKNVVHGANAVMNAFFGMPDSVQKITSAANQQRVEFERLVIVYTRLRNTQDRSEEQNKEYQKTIADLNANYPNYLQNVNLEADSWDSVTESLDRARKMLMDVVRARIQEAVFQEMEDEIVKHAATTVKLQTELDTLQAEFAAGTKSRTQMISSVNKYVSEEASVMATELQEIQTSAGIQEESLIARIARRKVKEDELTETMRRRMEVAERIYAIQPKDEDDPSTGDPGLAQAAENTVAETLSAYDKLLDGLSQYHSARELRTLDAHQRELAQLSKQMDEEQFVILSALAEAEITEEEAQVSLLAIRDKYNDLARGVQIRADAELMKLAEERTKKMLVDEATYYEAVQFADEQYFDWKKKKIEEEVEAMSLSDDQKMELIEKLLKELSELKKQYEIESSPKKAGKKSWFFSGLLGFDPDDEEDMAKIATIKDIYHDIMSQAAQVISGSMRLSAQRRDQEIADIEKRAEVESWTNERLLAEKEDINKHYEAKERKHKALQKGMALAQAKINIAEGVTKALSLGPIIGPALATMMGVLGAVQIGIISAQKFAQGGLFRGKGGPRDDANLAYISDGEYIVNAAATKRFKPMLDAINYGRAMPAMPRLGYAAGGQFMSSGLLEKIDTIIQKIEILNMNLVRKQFNMAAAASSGIHESVRSLDRARESMERSGYVQGGA